MRFIICFLIAAVVPFAFGKCGTCSLSGDQHFITLDGAEHHYNGRGWHRLYQLDKFEVQCLFADCKTGVETIDGHRRRNDGRRICLQACRARFTPPGYICPQIVSWEPLQVNGQGQSQIEVNGVRLLSGKGISQAAKDQSWWLRIERVGKDAVAMDVMMGEGVGGVALRLGPKRIVTVTVRGLQGGRGLCGSCDGLSSNDLAGATHVNISDCDGHNRFADAHRRGSAGFSLIPAKPECAGGSSINEQEEVEKLLKDAEAAKEQEEYVHRGNVRLAEIGSQTFRDGAPDYDPNLIVPPVATFANKSLLDTVVRDCQAGMLISSNDERMKMAIDNCVLDKARGHGFELAAASNIIAYVQSLMINEQADLAVQRLPLSRNFCAMCQSAIQTFIVDTKPILRHVIEKQAHHFDPGIATYFPLVPAPFELTEPDPTPGPTRPPVNFSNLTLGMSLSSALMKDKNATVPSLVTGSASSNHSLSSKNRSNTSAPQNVNGMKVGSGDITNATVTLKRDSGSENAQLNRTSSEISSLPESKHDNPSKKANSGNEAPAGKYHLKGSKPVSNIDDDEDEDESEEPKHRHHGKNSDSHKGSKKSSRRTDEEYDKAGNDDDEDDNDYTEKAKTDRHANYDDDVGRKSKSENTEKPNGDDDDVDDVDIKKKIDPAPKPLSSSLPILPQNETPIPTPVMTRAPIIPGTYPNLQETQAQISSLPSKPPIPVAPQISSDGVIITGSGERNVAPQQSQPQQSHPQQVQPDLVQEATAAYPIVKATAVEI